MENVILITSWKEVGHKHVGMRVIKHLREEGNYNVPLIFWEDEMTDVEYVFGYGFPKSGI